MSIAPNPSDLSPSPTVPAVSKSCSTRELSIIQRNSTTLEVCGHDTTFPSFLGTSEFFYDSHAGACRCLVPQRKLSDDRIVYENPLITATSRALISDIHALTHRCCAVDVPRPLSILYALLRSRPPNRFGDEPWFKAVRIWPEVDDISETESFDGHRKYFVEYTLNMLFFPDLHTTYRMPKTLALRRPPPSPAESQLSLSIPASPSLLIPGTPVSVPSPLHFQLPVMTRLSFNEQGQITYHRDIWDFRDVVQLIPGVRVALWVMTRAGAWGLSWISQRVYATTDPNVKHEESMHGENGLLTSTADGSI